MPVTNKSGFFVPAQMSGCVLWLDGMDPAGTGVAPSAGATVSTWNDKSVSAKHATSGGTPTYVAGGGVNFNGSSYFYNLAFAQNLSQRSIFIVMQETVRNSTNGVFPLIPDPSSGIDWQSTNGMSIETNNGLRFFGSVGYTSDIGNTSLLVKAIYNDNMNTRVGSGFLNGTNATNVTAAGTAGTCSGYGVGARWLGSTSMTYGLDGVIFEILFFNRPLVDIERRQVEGYLAQKWGLTSGLPAGHPGLGKTYYVSGANSSIVLRRPALAKVPYFSLFTPLSFTGCTLWLDASQDTTPNGVSIDSLVDRSGSGNSLTPSGTISAATNFLRGRTVYNFGSSRATKTNFPWQTSFTQIVLVKCATGNWLSSLVSSGATYLAYVYPGNWNLINVNNFFNPLDSVAAQGTSVFTTAADGVSSWIIFSIGYESNATSASNYTINGTVRTSATASAVNTAISATNQLWLNGNGTSSYDSQVYVAEMMHYNSVLTNSQRQQIEGYLAQKWGLLRNLPNNHGFYTNPGGGPQLGIVNPTISMTARASPIVSAGLLFHLDAGNAASYPGSGSTWTDLAGSGLTTTLYNSPTYSSANGGYLSFAPGSSQYAKTSASLSALTTWTVEIWHYYNATNGGGNPCIVSEVWNGTPINFTIGSSTGSYTSLQAAYFNGAWYTTATDYSLPSTGWYHIVGTYDGTTITLYINTVSTRTQASSGTPASSSLGIHIMRRWDLNTPADYWGGYISIVRIYSRALTSTEVSTNYSASKARFGLS